MDKTLSLFKRLIKKIINKAKPAYNFDKSNPLGGGGERVDFVYTDELNITKLDIYQLSHYRRYEFACKTINANEACGDFACGTGYGTVMLSQKSQKVIGADINEKVIATITKRYQHIKNIQFIHANLLDLAFDNVFDNIISFETIEHFKEEDILELLKIYNKSLKPTGKLIMSTPYLQERDEAALKLGYHLTFYVNEDKINRWLTDSGFQLIEHQYQNYQTHIIQPQLEHKDFIITLAQKIG
jgi:2-polyprenyl-3-methyl-5-hydroxy-6-metoxy-1,4-benzoquinol methylase